MRHPIYTLARQSLLRTTLLTHPLNAGSASGPCSRVYVLDMKTMVWSQLAPTTSQVTDSHTTTSFLWSIICTQ